MLPTLHPGERILAKRWHPDHRGPLTDQIVVCWHPYKTGVRLIKRLVERSDAGLVLLGDNPLASTDSRQLGPLPESLLIGVVVGRIQSKRPHNTASDVF